MRAEYRIVADNWAGFEVQWRRWWWPFWEMPVCNTHASIEAAERWARHFASNGKAVKKSGVLP